MSRILWAIGLTILGVICLGGLLAWQRARHFERLFHLVRLDPLGTAALRSDLPLSPAPRIVFFGDSRAAAWPAPHLPDRSIINRGVPGHTSAQARLRYPLHVSPLKPAIVVVQAGVNDLTALAVFTGDADRIIQSVIDNLRAIVAQARAEGSTVVLTTIFPLGPNNFERLDPATQRINAAIAQVNAAISAMAAPEVIIFDSAALLADDTGYIDERYRDDLLHINAEGYRVIGEALTEMLRALSGGDAGRAAPHQAT